MSAASLDSRIDELYRAPLGEFIAARDALAKTLTGDDAKRVRKLAKPTVVPWAINQVYWRARPVYDRVIKTGERLHAAQVAALEGRKADVRAATDAHREAIADAVQQATKIAEAEGSSPATDDLTRTFEALSLTPGSGGEAVAHGRLKRPLKPAGFEALSGLKIAAAAAPRPGAPAGKADAKKLEAARKKEDAARKKHEAEVKKAEAALERARRKMAEAQAALRETLNKG